MIFLKQIVFLIWTARYKTSIISNLEVDPLGSTFCNHWEFIFDVFSTVTFSSLQYSSILWADTSSMSRRLYLPTFCLRRSSTFVTLESGQREKITVALFKTTLARSKQAEKMIGAAKYRHKGLWYWSRMSFKVISVNFQTISSIA